MKKIQKILRPSSNGHSERHAYCGACNGLNPCGRCAKSQNVRTALHLHYTGHRSPDPAPGVRSVRRTVPTGSGERRHAHGNRCARVPPQKGTTPRPDRRKARARDPVRPVPDPPSINAPHVRWTANGARDPPTVARTGSTFATFPPLVPCLAFNPPGVPVRAHHRNRARRAGSATVANPRHLHARATLAAPCGPLAVSRVPCFGFWISVPPIRACVDGQATARLDGSGCDSLKVP